MFKHFILTRFNLKLDDFSEVDKNNQPVRTEEWLENRFVLFEDYCFPTLLSQSCKNFIWFVLFSTDTPERFVQIIKNYESQFPLFKPLFLESGDYQSIKKVFNDAMTAFLEPGDQYIITSRIDNDDAFHKDMISEVQKEFVAKDDIFLSFPYGLQVDVQKRVIARMHYKNNHFISRIEKIKNPVQTVITYNHAFIDHVSSVIYVDNRKKPLWLEIIHESNMKNMLDATSVPLFFKTGADAFQLKMRISVKNTFLACFAYIKLRVLLARAAFLKFLGLYDFLKGAFRKRQNN